MRGDVRDLSAFGDGEFDLAISLGLLEHLPDPVAFAATASEIQRVARQYALVVPYRYAWIEPHYLVPFFPVLPRRLQNALIRVFDLGGHRALVRDDPDFVGRRVRWRSNAEYRAAFPGSRTCLTPTRETVAIVHTDGVSPATTTIPSRTGRRFELLAHLGIEPTISSRIRVALDAAIDEAERRAPGSVAVLDAGCGRKSPLVPFRGRIDRFVGADMHAPDPPLPYLDEFAVVDLCGEDGPFADDTFDVILSNFTLEHFVDPPVAMANLHRWLRPGGTLVVTTVNRRHPFVAAYLWLPDGPRRRLQPLVKASAADAHPLVGICNDPVTIRATLTDAGFERIELEIVGNLARAWGRRMPTFALGVAGDLITHSSPSRRSSVLAVARKPAAVRPA